MPNFGENSSLFCDTSDWHNNLEHANLTLNIDFAIPQLQIELVPSVK